MHLKKIKKIEASVFHRQINNFINNIIFFEKIKKKHFFMENK